MALSPLLICTFLVKGLVTDYGEGGYKTGGRGGHVKFYPSEMGGGAEKVLAILKREREGFQFKKGGAKSFTLSWGGGGLKHFRTRDLSILYPPPSP